MAKTPGRTRAAVTGATGRMKFDQVDRAILRELQDNCKITNAMLSERVGISPPSTLERVKKLERHGVIRGYTALLDPESVGQSVLAIVHVSIREHSAATLENAKRRLSELDEVQACWYCAGDEDFILKVRVENMSHYERFISGTLAGIEGIGKLRTSLVLRTLTDSPHVSLNALAEP
jgi:Lrp/AsnC family leucine-responsive transcriptional regulator